MFSLPKSPHLPICPINDGGFLLSFVPIFPGILENIIRILIARFT
ncbi:hypothetical protein CWATWH8502_1773 [Crocosphaera watsonii WH 8502]|uniref:Uncharacterized protein n=3 Tax=Crocosphaera watsonii TaxID=263511 RepID=T2K0V2_CROWT|nr:hypothetical protein CWATWH0003_5332 [Crocosphaera watsonii WH 0003]CCQ51465.1 hypothetical protein CWATWH8502_1773 [Crocosphaera watsonii WH 8502]CCQ70827.1 hypothetical protein CWATWH0402_379 [Crocosphaera watsonii WH 0402]